MKMIEMKKLFPGPELWGAHYEGCQNKFRDAEILFRLKTYRRAHTFDRSNADQKYYNELQIEYFYHS